MHKVMAESMRDIEISPSGSIASKSANHEGILIGVIDNHALNTLTQRAIYWELNSAPSVTSIVTHDKSILRDSENVVIVAKGELGNTLEHTQRMTKVVIRHNQIPVGQNGKDTLPTKKYKASVFCEEGWRGRWAVGETTYVGMLVLVSP
jgi:hypothetical protein